MEMLSFLWNFHHRAAPEFVKTNFRADSGEKICQHYGISVSFLGSQSWQPGDWCGCFQCRSKLRGAGSVHGKIFKCLINIALRAWEICHHWLHRNMSNRQLSSNENSVKITTFPAQCLRRQSWHSRFSLFTAAREARRRGKKSVNVLSTSRLLCFTRQDKQRLTVKKIQSHQMTWLDVSHQMATVHRACDNHQGKHIRHAMCARDPLSAWRDISMWSRSHPNDKGLYRWPLAQDCDNSSALAME